jgi:hypothetical protein
MNRRIEIPLWLLVVLLADIAVNTGVIWLAYV